MRNLFLKVITFAAIIMLIASFGITVSAYEYPDEGYWANEAIDAAIDNGLLRGKEDGKMHSEDNLTRAEMAAIMVRSFGAEIKADISDYRDLIPSAWYYEDFAKAVQMRVFEGDGTGNMRPNDYITREEVFTVVARALVLNTDDYSALDKFNDKSDISSWAKGYMSILTQNSYVNGDNLGNSNPKKNITRAEFAQLMHNIFRNYYTKADTYTDKTDSYSSMVNTGDVTFKNVTVNGDLVIGDGNAKGTIRLENVNIKGRLLVRGSERVELVNTTVGEMVVVNNYNTVVHFDNYRDEAVFDDIILNTEATFKEKAATPVTPTPGGSGGGGGGGGGGSTTTIGYKTEYYVQSTDDLTKYVKHSQTSTVKAEAGTSAIAEVKEIEGFTYDPSNEKNVLSGTVPSKGVLTLKVYYTRNEYEYTVKYHKQDVNDLTKYDEVTADNYTKKGLFDAEVTADEKSYTGFKINTSKSVKSGKITADGKLVLNVYYDREKYDITFDGNGYTGKIPKEKAVYGQKITSLLPSITRDGYVLDGWYDGETKIDENYVVTGPVELKASWSLADKVYTVTYYIQNAELNGYSVYHTEQKGASEGEDVTADTANPIFGFVYDASHPENVISGTVPETGTLELKVYYKRDSFEYKVIYYTEDENGTYSTKEEKLSGVYGTEVSVVPSAGEGFELNTAKSTLKGVVDGMGNPKLIVYYDRKTMVYEVIYYTEDLDGSYTETLKEQKSAKYGARVSVTPAPETGFETNTSLSVVEGIIPLTGKLQLKVYYDRVEYQYTVTYNTQNVDGTYLKKTDVINAKYGKTVSVTPAPEKGFKVNTSESVLSGVVDNAGNPKLVVYYDREEYTITFDGNGYTEAIPSVTVLYGQKITSKLPTITRDGYVLDGWYDGETKIDENYTISGPVTLKAQWIAADAKYIVTYYVQNEDLSSYDEYTSKEFPASTDEDVTADTSFEIKGFEFNRNHNDNVLSGKVPATGVLELKLYYDRADFDYEVVIYEENLDGSHTEISKETKSGKFGTQVSATTSVPEGFELNNTLSTLSDKVKADGSTKLEVYYDRIVYTYTIKTHTEKVDGSYETVTETKSAKYGKAVSITPAPGTGFDYDSESSVISGTVTDGNLVLEVYYIRESYKITFDAGEGVEDPADITAYYGRPITLPTVSKTDYTFKGWSDGENTLNSEAIFTKGADLTAVWEYTPETISYTVEYYTQNKDLKTYSMTTEQKSGKVGTIASVTAADKKGFDVNIAKSELSGTISRENPLVLKVYYDREAYTITFDAGEGVTNPESITAYYDVTVTLPTVSKVDYTFKGWSDGANTLNGDATFTKDVDLTAVWDYTPGTVAYTIEYYTQNTDLETYEMTSEQKSGKADEKVNLTPDEKTGFDVNIAKSELSGTISRENPLVLKVYYDRESYTITFDAGEGVANPENITAYYGVEVTLPTVVKTDYTFNGWSDGANTLNGDVTFTKDTDLTAVWDYTPGVVVYTIEYYTQNTDLATYEMTSEQKSGKADEKVTVIPDEKTGFDVNIAMSELSGTISRENPLVLKVYYDRESYTITFDAGEGVANPENVIAYYGVEVTLPVVSKDDFSFMGWSDGTNTFKVVATFEKDTALTAVWEEIADVVTVTFYDMGSEVASVDVERNTTVDETQFPEHNVNYKGYVKDSSVSPVYTEKYIHVINYGWWYNTDTGKWEEFTTETVVTKDIDVHLKSHKFTAKVKLADGNAFDFYAFYEPETRFADSVKDIIYKKGPLTALEITGYYEKARENGKVQKVLDEEDNIMMLSYMVKISQILGEENVEKFIVDGAKESFGNNEELEESFVIYLEESVNSSDDEYVANTKGIMVRAFEHVIDDDPALVGDLEALAHSIMEDPAAFEEITGYDYDSTDEAQREEIIDEVVVKLEIPSVERDELVATLVDYMFTENHYHELEDMVYYAMVFLNDHPDERDRVVDGIIEELYSEDLDKLVDQIINDDQFEINDRITFVAEGMKNTLLRDYNYETLVGSKIPARLEKAFEIYPEEKIIELYDYAMNNWVDQIDEAIATAESGDVGLIDSGVTPVVNVIADLYVPLHEGLTQLLEDKASDKYYYSENIYLQELVKLLDPEVWVYGSENAKPSDTTGYKIYDLEYYYDLLYKIVVLGDDAILWYYENLSEEEYVELTNNYQELAVKYANIIAENVNAYVTDGTLPDIHDKVNDKLTSVEKALLKKYPDLINGLIDKYKNSEYFGREATADDYKKLRDKVYEIFVEGVTLTTDEYFDKILNREAIEDLENKVEDKIEDKLDGKLDGEYYTKIDDNTYEFEVNDYIIRFIRELVD